MDFQTEHVIALAATTLLSLLLGFLVAKIQADRKLRQFQSLSKALSSVKSNLEIKQSELDAAQQELDYVNRETKDLQNLLGKEKELQASIKEHKNHIENLQSQIQELTQKNTEKASRAHALMKDIDLYTRIEGFTAHGHFEMPEYLYETSDRFAEEIKFIREKQKQLISENSAVKHPEITTISDDPIVNKKILSSQVKLMLTAFNIECDKLIGRVKPSTFSSTLERIEKLANKLEKSAASLACGFNIEYVELKFQECKLQFQFTLKKKEEQEEQKAIREQIREEQRAIKEYEKAVAEAEKEERMYRDLLEKAREELLSKTEEERAETEAKIAALEQQLAEAEAKEARAKSMAEQTRKGHVYVISNIGSFGEDIYKIGLTRRLDPLDRVKELGDASVPFSFDIHAMIYVEDAPALESALHRQFSEQRINLVNYRKEFFNVDLQEIKQAVTELAGEEAEFKTTIVAEEYFESRRLRGQKAQSI